MGEQGPEWKGQGACRGQSGGRGHAGALSGIPSHYLVSHPINESPKWNSSLLDILSYSQHSL